MALFSILSGEPPGFKVTRVHVHPGVFLGFLRAPPSRPLDGSGIVWCTPYRESAHPNLQLETAGALALGQNGCPEIRGAGAGHLIPRSRAPGRTSMDNRIESKEKSTLLDIYFNLDFFVTTASHSHNQP